MDNHWIQKSWLKYILFSDGNESFNQKIVFLLMEAWMTKIPVQKKHQEAQVS